MDLSQASLVGLAVLSGWPDSNRRPPRPKRGALAKLRYSPYVPEFSVPGCHIARHGQQTL
jgi:hypothetical protein